jgi:TonB family protein
MKIKDVFVLAAALLIFDSNSFSQTVDSVRQMPDVPPSLSKSLNGPPDFFKVGDVTGNVGGVKAIILVKPAYPDAAKEIGAEGKVRVEIEIEEAGNVISAKAVSGQPSLYEAAQNAALKSKFNTPTVNGLKTKVSGHLNYNFLIETPSWFIVGYSLPGAIYSQPPVIKKVFQADWAEENALIDQLTEIKRLEPKNVRPILVNESVETTGSKTFVRQSVQGTLIVPPRNYEAGTISQNLINSLQKRLANDELNLWKFNLGLNILEAIGNVRNPAERQDSSLIVKRAIETAPSNVSPEVLAELKRLLKLFDEENFQGFKPKSNGAYKDIHRELEKSLQILFKIIE